MPKYYLYNTTDKTYFHCPTTNYTSFSGVEHICLDNVFKKSLQAVQMEFVKNPNGNLLSFTNTDSKKNVIKLDQKYRENVFNLPEKKLKATQSNPIVMAITKKVKFTNRCPAYYRVLSMGDYILVILISGIIFIEDENGEWFEMQRSLPTEAYIPKEKDYEDTYTARHIASILESHDPLSDLPFNAIGLIDIITTLKRYYKEYAKGNEEKYYTGLEDVVNSKCCIIFNEPAWERFVKRQENKKSKLKKNNSSEKNRKALANINSTNTTVAMLDESMMEDDDFDVDYSELDNLDNTEIDLDTFEDDDFSEDIEDDLDD